MSTTVRVDEETHEKLKSLRREGESLDDVISRLIDERNAKIDEGAGFWEEEAAEAAREARRSTKDEIGKTFD